MSTAVNQELTKCEWSVWAVVVACVLIVSQHQDRGAQEPRGTRCRIRTISSISRFYAAKSYSAKIPSERTKSHENLGACEDAARYLEILAEAQQIDDRSKLTRHIFYTTTSTLSSMRLVAGTGLAVLTSAAPPRGGVANLQRAGARALDDVRLVPMRVRQWCLPRYESLTSIFSI